MQATSRHLRISPKKINLIAGLVRKKNVSDALDILRFTPKKGAYLLSKTIKSAASNAENNFKQNVNHLYVEEIIVGEGPMFKRSIPVSRGRTHPILKRTSHVKVRVAVRMEKEPKPKSTPESKSKKQSPSVIAKE